MIVLSYEKGIRDAMAVLKSEAERMYKVREVAGFDDGMDFYDICMQCQWAVEQLLEKK